MDVQRAESRSLQKSGRQKQSVSSHHQRIRPQRTNLLELGSALEPGRLAHRDTARQGEPLDGASGGQQATTGRAVGLRENQGNLVPGVQQARQRPLSELGRAGED